MKVSRIFPISVSDSIHLAHFVHVWYAQLYYEGAILVDCSGGNLGDSLTSAGGRLFSTI